MIEHPFQFCKPVFPVPGHHGQSDTWNARSPGRKPGTPHQRNVLPGRQWSCAGRGLFPGQIHAAPRTRHRPGPPETAQPGQFCVPWAAVFAIHAPPPGTRSAHLRLASQRFPVRFHLLFSGCHTHPRQKSVAPQRFAVPSPTRRGHGAAKKAPGGGRVAPAREERGQGPKARSRASGGQGGARSATSEAGPGPKAEAHARQGRAHGRKGPPTKRGGAASGPAIGARESDGTERARPGALQRAQPGGNGRPSDGRAPRRQAERGAQRRTEPGPRPAGTRSPKQARAQGATCPGPGERGANGREHTAEAATAGSGGGPRGGGKGQRPRPPTEGPKRTTVLRKRGANHGPPSSSTSHRSK